MSSDDRNPIFPPSAPQSPNFSFRPAERKPNGISGIRLFRVLGITVYLHWSWFIVAMILIDRSIGHYSSFSWKVAEYLSLFAIVLTHEFGHALACRSVGGKADQITLWPLGGIAYVNPPPRPGAMLWSIAAGPLVNVLLLLPTYYLSILFRDGNANIAQFTNALFIINLGLLLFNILPIYPLDGGQILQSILWFFTSQGTSLMIAAWIGMVGAAALVLLAIFVHDWWLVALALFAGSMAWRGIKIAQILLRRQKLGM